MCVFVFCYPKIPPDWDVLSLFRQKPAGYHALCILTMFLKQYSFPAFLLESCCLLTHRCCLKAFIHWMHFFFLQIFARKTFQSADCFHTECERHAAEKQCFIFGINVNFSELWHCEKKNASTNQEGSSKPTSRPSPATTATMLFVWTSQHRDTNHKNINLKDNLRQSISLHQHPETCVELVVVQF